MSMQVGQIIKPAMEDNKSEFCASIKNDVEIGYVHDYSYDNSDYKFYNTCLSIDGGFKSKTSYYFNMPIWRKKDYSQEIIIEFYDGDYNTERVKTITIPALDKARKTTQDYIEFVATPSVNYKYLAFRIIRVANDYTFEDLKDEMLPDVIGITNAAYLPPGRVVKFISEDSVDTVNDETIQIYRMTNILPNGIKPKKIGIQGMPGTVMSINGEEIRIGYRGVYELLNGITIETLGIIPMGLEPIIIDYQYET